MRFVDGKSDAGAEDTKAALELPGRLHVPDRKNCSVEAMNERLDEGIPKVEAVA